MLVSKMSAMHPSKPTAIELLQRIGRTFFAAFLLVALPLGAWAGSTTTEQRAYLNGHSSQSFEEVRNAEFKAYPKLKKLPLSEKAVWIKLHFDEVNQPERDRYLLIRHDLFEEIWLYHSDHSNPNQWARKQLNLATEKFIGLGQVKEGEDIYLLIPSAIDIPIFTFVGTEDEVINYEKDITLSVVVIAALGLGIAVHILISLMLSFSLTSLVSTAYLISFILLFAVVSGALRQALPALTIEALQSIHTPNILLTNFFSASIFYLTVCALLRKIIISSTLG